MPKLINTLMHGQSLGNSVIIFLGYNVKMSYDHLSLKFKIEPFLKDMQ